MRKVARIHGALLLVASAALPACKKSPAEIQKHLQEDLIRAEQGAVIELPEGKFHFDRTLSLTVDKVTSSPCAPSFCPANDRIVLSMPFPRSVTLSTVSESVRSK